MTAAIERRPRVLCVDDDAFMLNVLTRAIGADYEVLTSNSGAEALPPHLLHACTGFVLVALLIVAAVGGWRGYEYLEAKKAAEAGVAYDAAVELAEAAAKALSGSPLATVPAAAPPPAPPPPATPTPPAS